MSETRYERRLGMFGPKRAGSKTHVIIVPIVDGVERGGWPACQQDRGYGARTIKGGDPAQATCKWCSGQAAR